MIGQACEFDYAGTQAVKALREEGYEVVTARYVNMPGFFAWLLVSRMLRKRPTDSGLSRLYDKRVVPIARAVESRMSPPFGQSVLVIGRVSRSSAPG